MTDSCKKIGELYRSGVVLYPNIDYQSPIFSPEMGVFITPRTRRVSYPDFGTSYGLASGYIAMTLLERLQYLTRTNADGWERANFRSPTQVRNLTVLYNAVEEILRKENALPRI